MSGPTRQGPAQRVVAQSGFDARAREGASSGDGTTGMALDHAAVLGLQRAVGNRATRQALGRDASPVAEIERQRRSGGDALPEHVRASAERSIGREVGAVQVHADPDARALADRLGARAFTVGRDVWLGRGESVHDRRLLSHELTHVAQQAAVAHLPLSASAPPAVGAAVGALEAEATRAADGARPRTRTEQPLSAPMVLRERKRDTRPGPRSGDVKVKWSSDDGEFYRRRVAAVARHFGLDESGLWQPFHDPAMRLHSQLAPRGLKEGERVKVTIAFRYDPENLLEAGEATLTPESDPRAEKRQKEAAASGDLPYEEEPPPPLDETTEQRLRRQARTTARALSRVVADADRNGRRGVTFTITHDGEELSFGFQVDTTPSPRPAGTVPVSAATVLREHFEPQLEMILMSGPGERRIEFARDSRGRMSFVRSAKVEEPQPFTEEDLDLPDRKKIYKEILTTGMAEVKEVAVLAASFTLEQIALMIAGGVLLRGLGIVARLGGRALPLLRDAILLRKAAPILEGSSILSKAESEELGGLLKTLEKKVLTPAQEARLTNLLTKLEEGLGAGTVRLPRITGTEGLAHSFDRHAEQWFGRAVNRQTHLAQWEELIVRVTRSKQTFTWELGGERTTAYLGEVEGKPFVAQYFQEGPRAGELATAFVPDQSQLARMLALLGK